VDLVENFKDRNGAAPVVVGSAPGRVNLIGEHLDYNGGSSLPIALTYRTEVAAAPRDDGMIVMESLQADGRVELQVADLATAPEGWSAYVAGVLWALDHGGQGWTLLVDGQVPNGAGLSSSAALECAVAMAVTALDTAPPSRDDMVAACVRAENDYVGAPTGSMDQTVSVFAEDGHALLIDFAEDTHRTVPWGPPGDLLVIDTRASHALVGGEYADRRRACEAAAEELGVRWLAQADLAAVEKLTDPVARRRARHVVTEVARINHAVTALEAGDWELFGRLMTESHTSLRDDYEVSVPELDIAVDAALDAGAIGARMTGGGFGGSVIALVPPGGVEAVRDSVEAAYRTAGFDAPGFLDGAAGGPASFVDLRDS
jgi:galactokinase